MNVVAMDLLTGTLEGNGAFSIGWFSIVSDLTRLLRAAPLSVDIDLLTEGDGVLGFVGPPSLSSVRTGIFGIVSLSEKAEGNLDLLCFPEEQLLA